MTGINCIYMENYVFRKDKGKLKFLIIKRNKKSKVYPGIWQIVTGKIEPDEKAYDTAIREVKEETGLNINRLYVMPHTTTFYAYYFDVVTLIPLFFCEVIDEDVLLSDEHSDYKWLSAGKASEKLFFKSQKENVLFINKNFKKDNDFKSFVELDICNNELKSFSKPKIINL